MKTNRRFFIILLILIVGSLPGWGQALEPFSKIIKTPVGKYNSSSWIQLPVITWGADIVTIHANGGKLKMVDGSFFDQQGLKIQLFREDDFKKQVEKYLAGEINFLRGTMGMLNMAADITEKDARTKMVVIYQHSWSVGGDALVVKQNIRSVKDLQGKTIALQQYGPHVDYFMKLLEDAGLKAADVKILWTKDLVGPEGDTPMAKLYLDNVDAAFVIIPDALALSSGGGVGTGAEDSVKGGKILLSTKTASRIISDVYAVRKDYFDANKSAVQKMVQALLLAEEAVRGIFGNPKGGEYQRLSVAAATILLDSAQLTEDAAGLYYDAEHVGYNGNVQFFSDANYPRNFEKLNNEIQNSYLSLKLITQKHQLAKAGWNYADLSRGLKNIDPAVAARFDESKVSTVVTRRQQLDTIDESTLFSFKIYFKPNQNTFSMNLYKTEFAKVIELASTYGGAIITVEGHSDPMGYLKQQKAGAAQIELNRIKQAAKNLSYSRANEVRDEIIKFATSLGITLDASQFAVVGLGISRPVYEVPATEQQWLDNMRVEFKIIQVEAEASVFSPL